MRLFFRRKRTWIAGLYSKDTLNKLDAEERAKEKDKGKNADLKRLE